MPEAIGRLAAFLPAEGQHGRPHVAGMELELLILTVLDLVGDAHAQRLAARAPRCEVGTLGDDHVAAIAAAPIEKAPRGGAVPHWRHHLEEAVTDGKKRVLEPVLAHARVAVAHLEAEDLAEGVDDGGELPDHQTDLPHAKVHGLGHRMSPSSVRMMRHLTRRQGRTPVNPEASPRIIHRCRPCDRGGWRRGRGSAPAEWDPLVLYAARRAAIQASG